MKQSFITYKGLYGDNSLTPVIDFIHTEPLEERSKMYNWEIQEHLHTDLVQLFVIESGQGVLLSEKKESRIKGPCVILIPPNFLHGFSFQSGTKGEVITFSESYLVFIEKGNTNISFNLNRLGYFDFENQVADFERVLFFKKSLSEEIKTDQIEKHNSILYLFSLLFISLSRFNFSQTLVFSETENKTLKYLQEFQKNVRKDFLNNKSIKEYAKELHITTVHLNRVCQAVLNKTPIQIIHEQVIVEAKKYLLNTKYSISEISYFLNFNDPAYFTRFFKKIEGVSPSDFRKI
jgi:AraC family transcriptional regulator, transcriptional activator of pobA